MLCEFNNKGYMMKMIFLMALLLFTSLYANSSEEVYKKKSVANTKQKRTMQEFKMQGMFLKSKNRNMKCGAKCGDASRSVGTTSKCGTVKIETH